uniref:Transposase n=1 Tax=Ascaris lumbricoides TaxID=6252 RepID=A0A0M3HJ32_ASCLU
MAAHQPAKVVLVQPRETERVQGDKFVLPSLLLIRMSRILLAGKNTVQTKRNAYDNGAYAHRRTVIRQTVMTRKKTITAAVQSLKLGKEKGHFDVGVGFLPFVCTVKSQT